MKKKKKCECIYACLCTFEYGECWEVWVGADVVFEGHKEGEKRTKIFSSNAWTTLSYIVIWCFLSKCFTSFVRTQCQSSLHWPKRRNIRDVLKGLCLVCSLPGSACSEGISYSCSPKTQWLFFALNLWAANTRKDPIEFHIANAPGAVALRDWLAIVTNNVWKGRENYFYRIKWGPASQMAAWMREKKIIKLITSSDIASWAWLKC